jgi:hypothetical protein
VWERKEGYRLGWEKMNRDRVEQGDVNTYSLVHMIRRGIPMTFSMAWSYGTRLGGSYVDIVAAGSSSCGLITSLNRGLIYDTTFCTGKNGDSTFLSSVLGIMS